MGIRRIITSVLVRGPKREVLGSSHRWLGDGRSVTANPDTEGKITVDAVGKPAQGESDTRATCKVPFDFLNAAGEGWTTIEDDSSQGSDVDCRFRAETRTLELQVVRVNPDSLYRRRLGKQGAQIHERVTTDTMIEVLCTAIASKLDRRRTGLTLVLNATETPQCCNAPVVEQYRQKYLDRTKSLGFDAVWLVGLSVDLVYRLD